MSGSEFDENDLDVEGLVRALAEHKARPRSSVESWLEAEGYKPGATRCLVKELWPKYQEWLKSHPEAGPYCNNRRWGKIMTSLFKKGRGKYGYYYYISRESESELRAKLSKAASNPPGGGGTR